MFNIQILNAIAPTGLAEFPKEKYRIAENITQPDALLVRSFDLHDFKFYNFKFKITLEHP